MRRLGEGRVGCRLVANVAIDRQIRCRLVPDLLRARQQRVLHARHRRENIVIDIDEFGAVFGLVGGFGDDDRHRLADMTNLVHRQHRLIVDEGFKTGTDLNRHVGRAEERRLMIHLDHAVGSEILARQHGDDPGRSKRLGDIDRTDARVGMG